MTRFCDKSGYVLEIEMVDLHSGNSWERDFFETGALQYDDGRDAYMVEDVGYLADRADDYMLGRGDFYGDLPRSEQTTCSWCITATVDTGRIKDRRKAAGYTQQQLAQFIGATQKQVSTWESGTNEPSLRHLKAIAKVLACRVDDLI